MSLTVNNLELNVQKKLPSKSLNDMPEKVLNNIVSNLDLLDKFNVRQVSKAFNKSVVEILSKQKDLVVSDPVYLLFVINRWYTTNDLIDYAKDVIYRKDLIYDSYLLNIRRIKIFFCLNFSEFKRLGSSVPNLEHLEILAIFDPLIQPVNESDVLMPNLKILLIEDIHPNQIQRIRIETPRLHFVYFGGKSVNYIIPNNCMTVDYLEFVHDNYQTSLRYVNAKVIHCHSMLEAYDSNLLTPLLQQPQLTELNLNLINLIDLTYSFKNFDISKLGRAFDFLSSARIRLKVRVNIYIQGVLLINGWRFENYAFRECPIALHHKSFCREGVGRMTSCIKTQYPSLRLIHFSELLSIVRDPIFIDQIPGRYSNIQEIQYDRRNDANDASNFYRFLLVCNHISNLVIYFSGLPQQFFDEAFILPSLVNSLCSFKLFDDETLQPRVLDFKFLSNLKHLHLFGSNIVPSKMVAKIASEYLKAPVSFSLYFKRTRVDTNKVIIDKYSENCYRLTIYESNFRNVDIIEKKRYNNIDLDDLENHIKKNKYVFDHKFDDRL